jgi:hypothetical protein
VPPLQALAALHGFWIVVAVPALVVALRRLTPKQLRLLGLALTTAGVVGLLVFIVQDLARWLRTVPPEIRRYSFQRILFAIGTKPDVPLVQVAAAGAVCWIVGILRNKRDHSARAHE